ncbi:MAG TPA: tryptophan halogenase family protein [Caulobacterales bacterium]|nr:tryptophan halogenase family protein [Caulobacterales bacterium]
MRKRGMKDEESLITKIVIVGGGTAGWMAAAALGKILRNAEYSITLVESDEIGIVGVGEATIPPIMTFNNTLKIDEADFMRATNATFKLGIEFVDWLRLGHNYFHPFGTYGVEMEAIHFHHFWIRHRLAGGQRTMEEFNSATMAARAGKFGRTADPSPLPAMTYAYQFDASLYAKYLRNFAEKLGVKRVEGRIVDVVQRGEDGFIEKVVLEGGRDIEGELFIDCSGFRGLLIEQTLKSGYEDWSRWLPCNRAVAAPCERTERITPYTRSTAREAGWQWRIPLQHRTGNGYVYCSDFMDDDEAERLLVSRLDGPLSGKPRRLKFVTGMRKEAWKKNCLSLGLASGFLEPLESTSIHLIQSGIGRLFLLFPRSGFDPAMIEKYNAMSRTEYEHIRDFLVLHYKATEREDTPFWRHCRQLPLTDSLQERWDLYRREGHLVIYPNELFKESSWFAVFTGQGVAPQSYHPFADNVPEAELERRLSLISGDVMKRVYNLPTHEQYIAQYCASAMAMATA